MKTPMRPLMKIPETAEYFSVSVRTIHNWLKADYIPHIRQGRIIRFSPDILDEWIDKLEALGQEEARQKRASSVPPSGSLTQIPAHLNRVAAQP